MDGHFRPDIAPAEGRLSRSYMGDMCSPKGVFVGTPVWTTHRKPMCPVGLMGTPMSVLPILEKCPGYNY